VGFGNSVTVTVNAGSFSNGGSAVVSAGNNGPPAAVVVTYTPVAGAQTSTYTETFSYTIDDGVLPASTATVSVTVVNSAPVAADANFAVSTLGFAPPKADTFFGTYTVDLSGPVGDLPIALTIDTQGARGTATVSTTPPGNVITYTITDPTFLVGTDTITYTITDADGESDSGVLTIFADDGLPVLAPIFIVTAKGKTSVPLNVRIDKDGGLLELRLGNGTLEDHVLEVSAQGAHGTCALQEEDGVDQIWFTLVYTPTDRGYVGPDNGCALTVTDGDGDVATTSVSVKVVERSPIGGASSMDPWSLLLLAVAPVLRRFRRRPRGSASPRIRVVAALVLMAASVGASGQVQGPSPPKAADARSSAALTEIVVTSRKIEEKLLEVPLAITAFGADTIESKGIANITDVATQTPGFSFFNPFGEQLPVPVIRGIAPTDIFGANNAAFFIDGVYISGREGLNFGLLDLERIEVVKGPQSALYGRNAFSGAINYVVKPPSEDFEAKTSLEVGSENKLKGTAMISGPILGEKFRGRIAGLYDDWDGSYENALSDNDIGGRRFRTVQGSLLWLPAEAWSISLSYFKSNDSIDEGANVSLPANCEDRVNDNNAAVRLQNFCGEVPDIEDIPGLNGGRAIPKVAQATGENRELDRANFKVEWDLEDNGTISALTGYSKTQQDSATDFQQSLGEQSIFLYCPNAVNTPGIPNTCGTDDDEFLSFFRTGIYLRSLGGETKDVSQELRFDSPVDKRFRYSVGGYWFKVETESQTGGIFATSPLPDNGNVALPPFSDPPDSPNLAIGSAIFAETFTPNGGIDPLLRPVGNSETEGWAIFASTDFDFTDRLTGRAELRSSEERQETNILRYTRCVTSATTNGVLGNCLFPDQLVPITGDAKYDLRVPGAVPLFGPDCQFTSLEGLLKPGTPGQCSRNGSSRFDSVTGRVGLDFALTDDWLVYGSIAYGEKPGGLQLTSAREIAPGGEITTVVITNPFEEEQLTAYELGLKGTTWDGRMTVSSSVFYNDWQKIVFRQLVETNPDNGRRLEQPLSLNVNAGDAGVLGLEIETNLAFTDNLSSRLTVGWAYAEFNEALQENFAPFPTYAAEGYLPGGGDVSGNKVLRQPEWLLSGSLDYKHVLVSDWDWYAGVNANYQSGVYVGNDNQGYLPAHTYVDPRLGVKNGVYTFELWARNVFNDNGAVAAFRDIYWTNSTDQYSAVPVGATIPGARPGFDDFVPLRYTVTYPNERTFGISARMRFGAAVR
jgi:outer membrane receptor protein involved in Fe transport